jgi:hypothetical protein
MPVSVVLKVKSCLSLRELHPMSLQTWHVTPSKPCSAGGAPCPGLQEGAKQKGKGQSNAPRLPGRLCCSLCGRALAGTCANAWGARWLHRELQCAMSERIWQGILNPHMDDNDLMGQITAAAMLC